MNIRQSAQDLLQFIEDCPTAYQTVQTIKENLIARGYIELHEHAAWEIRAGQGYFITRNGSSVIAFRTPTETTAMNGYHILATHGDAPTFKLKPAFEKKADGGAIQWNVERYGGMICSSWMDRPLAIAGRVVVSDESGVHSVPVHLRRDMAIIPNVAIHMDRSVNEGKKFNPQVDMLPLVGLAREGFDMTGALMAELGQGKEIISHDLFLYARDRGSVWGERGEMISAPRLDDLMCTFAALQGFLGAAHPNTVPVLAVFDNEEIGSSSRQGAGSSLLRDTLTHLDSILSGGDALAFGRHIANSVILSADNAHAVHPNHPEYSDANNRPVLGGGVVIKYNAEQRYATDAVSAAVFGRICAAAGVPTQRFANRSDIRGGSTLGNIAVSDLPCLAIDIGLAQLAMHSAYETASTADLDHLITAAHAFFASSVKAAGDGEYAVEVRL